MSYIPLDEESKVKGKAAIDVVGARLGKSGGSLAQQILMLFVPSVAAMAPWVGSIFLLFGAGWIICVRYLGKRYNNLVAAEEATEQKIRSKQSQPIMGLKVSPKSSGA